MGAVMPMSRLIFRATVACLGLLAACCMAEFSAPAQAQSLKKIKVTVPTAALSFYPLYYAQEKGIFAKEGLDVEVISTNGDGPDVDAVLSGSVPFAISTPNRLFTAFEQGKTLKAVAQTISRMSIECAINKQVAEKLGITEAMPLDEKIKLMKGLTVGGTRPGAFTYLLLETYARRAGLVPQKDLKIIGVGGVNSMLPAVENNQIAIGCTGSPFIELAVKRGKAIRFTNNANGNDPAFDGFMYHIVHARPDFVEKEPDTVRHFLRGWFTAIEQIMTTPSESHLTAIKARFGGSPDDVLLESFENIKKVFDRSGRITPESVQKAAKFMTENGVVKSTPTFEQIATNDFLPKR
ncbi:MAG: ABC transporter substrate-binding protein [Rhizobiales bacterium]|nr:ABC transporter substrate-binding protein [Hyphomicrobiales bacterium]